MINKFSVYLNVSVNMSNPNGDPDAEGGPRVTTDGYGLISNGSIKSKIRSILSQKDNILWDKLKTQFNLTSQDINNCYNIWESSNKGYDGVKNTREAANKFKEEFKDNLEEAISNRYYDVRLFGTTALEQKAKDSICITKTGPVVVSPLFTSLPVLVTEQTITKSFPMRDNKKEGSGDGDQGDLCPGAFKAVNFGLYEGRILFNPFYEKDSKITQQDINIFKKVLPYIFAATMSNCRPDVNFRQILWAEHDSPLGSFSERDFFDACSPEILDKNKIKDRISATSINDFRFKTVDEIKNSVKNLTKLVDLLEEN